MENKEYLCNKIELKNWKIEEEDEECYNDSKISISLKNIEKNPLHQLNDDLFSSKKNLKIEKPIEQKKNSIKNIFIKKKIKINNLSENNVLNLSNKVLVYLNNKIKKMNKNKNQKLDTIITDYNELNSKKEKILKIKKNNKDNKNINNKLLNLKKNIKIAEIKIDNLIFLKNKKEFHNKNKKTYIPKKSIELNLNDYITKKKRNSSKNSYKKFSSVSTKTENLDTKKNRRNKKIDLFNDCSSLNKTKNKFYKNNFYKNEIKEVINIIKLKLK